jgi:hypothetical protein
LACENKKVFAVIGKPISRATQNHCQAGVSLYNPGQGVTYHPSQDGSHGLPYRNQAFDNYAVNFCGIHGVRIFSITAVVETDGVRGKSTSLMARKYVYA